MYKKSIKSISKCLVPFTEGLKYYGSNDIEHVIGTMIVLNKDGDLLTCKHIAEEFIRNDKINQMYKSFLKALESSRNKKSVLKEFGISDNMVVTSLINLPFKIENNINVEIKLHKYLDLAIIRFHGIKFNLDNYPIFSKKLIEQGQSVCKLGFAFPEYSMFEYNEELKQIVIKKDLVINFPLFPLDGIATRHININNELSMFETSTPGLKGQSGGPVFSPEGLIYGMQCMTKQLDLNFDIEAKVKRGIIEKQISYTPFMNLGVAINSVEIIKFLEDNNISFESR